MRKTSNLFHLKKPVKWEMEHLIDMMDVYRENGEMIRVFKDLNKNSFILMCFNHTVRFNSLRDLCELLWPYYESLMRNKKKNVIENYFKKKFFEEVNYGKLIESK